METTDRSVAQLSMLHTLANQLNQLRDVEAIGEAIAHELHELIDYHSCRVYELLPDALTLYPVSFAGDLEYEGDTIEGLLMTIDEGLTGHVARSRRSYYCPNTLEDPFAQDIPGTDEVAESMMGVPLTYGDDLVGVIIISKLGVDLFDEDDLRVLEVLAPHAAVAIVNARHVEEIEASRDQLKTLDDMKTMFLEAVSHDLRTPLATVLGISLTLSRGDIELSPDEIKDLLTRLTRNALKLERLLEDLLDLDRLMRGIVEPNRRPTDLNLLIRAVVEQEESLADRTVVIEGESMAVSLDAAKVERIIENLLVNAARHTPDTGRIWVRTEPEGTGVLISVEDEGPGIPADARISIFEPFSQGPASDRHSPGVGIGLSLVSRFAELHGGKAWVDERIGGGAAFRVLIPGPEEAGETAADFPG